MKEHILCAAIWYKDLGNQNLRAINIDRGLLVCGYRHKNCIDIVKQLAKLRTVRFASDSAGETVQGFLTNTNRFVNRVEAAQIALNAEQIKKPLTQLFSEDLY